MGHSNVIIFTEREELRNCFCFDLKIYTGIVMLYKGVDANRKFSDPIPEREQLKRQNL